MWARANPLAFSRLQPVRYVSTGQQRPLSRASARIRPSPVPSPTSPSLAPKTPTIVSNQRTSLTYSPHIYGKQRKHIQALVLQDPLTHTPTQLARQLKTTAHTVTSHIRGAPKWTIRYLLRMKKDYSHITGPQPLRPSQIRLHSWIQSQIDHTVDHRNQKTRWRRSAYHELKVNNDMRFLRGLDIRLGRMQEAATRELAEARRKRLGR